MGEAGEGRGQGSRAHPAHPFLRSLKIVYLWLLFLLIPHSWQQSDVSMVITKWQSSLIVAQSIRLRLEMTLAGAGATTLLGRLCSCASSLLGAIQHNLPLPHFINGGQQTKSLSEAKRGRMAELRSAHLGSERPRLQPAPFLKKNSMDVLSSKFRPLNSLGLQDSIAPIEAREEQRAGLVTLLGTCGGPCMGLSNLRGRGR